MLVLMTWMMKEIKRETLRELEVMVKGNSLTLDLPLEQVKTKEKSKKKSDAKESSQLSRVNLSSVALEVNRMKKTLVLSRITTSEMCTNNQEMRTPNSMVREEKATAEVVSEVVVVVSEETREEILAATTKQRLKKRTTISLLSVRSLETKRNSTATQAQMVMKKTTIKISREVQTEEAASHKELKATQNKSEAPEFKPEETEVEEAVQPKNEHI
jgi:hypothetical protein